MSHKIILLICNIIRIFTTILPDTPYFMRFRGALYRPFMKSCGKNFQVSTNVIIKGIEFLNVGNDVYIAPGCQLILREGCSIGDEVLIGPLCVIVDGNHGFDGFSYRFKSGKVGKIEIQDGVWLAAGCVITQSSKVGESSLIGPNCVVRGNVPKKSKVLSPTSL